MIQLIRQKPTLTMQAADRLAQAALAHALANGLTIAAAVVDDRGAPLVLMRMDAAQPSLAELALDKAYTATVTGSPTTVFAEHMLSQPRMALGLSNRPRLLPWGGGLPVCVDGQVVGGVGVSGASEDDDAACARAALAAISLS